MRGRIEGSAPRRSGQRTRGVGFRRSLRNFDDFDGGFGVAEFREVVAAEGEFQAQRRCGRPENRKVNSGTILMNLTKQGVLSKVSKLTITLYTIHYITPFVKVNFQKNCVFLRKKRIIPKKTA